MSNYYRAEDVQRILCGWCGVCANPTVENLLKCDDICPEFRELQPFIPDVRKIGKWIRGDSWSEGIGMGEDYGFYYHCSLCLSTVKGDYDKCGFKYCPFCGSKMRGGDGDA